MRKHSASQRTTAGAGACAARGGRDGKHLKVLLLIAAQATFLQWTFGLVARRHGPSRHFQVNAERCKTVLSVVFSGITQAHPVSPTWTAAAPVGLSRPMRFGYRLF